MKITKKFLLSLLKMSKEERVQKACDTGNYLYCLDAKKCLKEFYGVEVK